MRVAYPRSNRVLKKHVLLRLGKFGHFASRPRKIASAYLASVFLK